MLPRMDPDRGRVEIIAGPTFACKTEEIETAGTRRFQRFPRARVHGSRITVKTDVQPEQDSVCQVGFP
jgi:hypothetical protein